MNYASIISASCVDFHSWSTVIQVSGCSHSCHNCFNRSAWKSNYGQPFTEETYQELLEAASKPFISNVVIQGGDILFHKNVQEGITLCRRLKKDLSSKNIVVFSGYTYQEIKNDLLRSPILEVCDYLMDGKYEHSLPTTKPWRGSDRQVLHKLVNGVSVEQS